MNKITERLREIEQRKAALQAEATNDETTKERLDEIAREAATLNGEATELRGRLETMNALDPVPVPEMRGGKGGGSGLPTPESVELRAAELRESGHMSMPMFVERRSLLVSSGKLATPTAVSPVIGELPSVVCSIVDDVDVMDATGTGSWQFPYKISDAKAAAVTEGETVGGTGATYGKMEIGPSEWGVLDEVSNQVAKMTNVAYATSVQNSAYLALRREVRDRIVTAVLESKLAETRYGVKMDDTYVRNVMLGYDSDESVAGNAKLYINKEDLDTLGKVRGTSEKKPVFDISFITPNNGQIKDGGTVIPFSICSKLAVGTQIYGNTKTVKLLLWGNYEISTDQGGDYFKRNMLGIRALATAGTGLTVWHGMQIIKQEAAPASQG